MKATLNVAVVGAGLYGRVHLSAYRQHPRVRVLYVCDLDEERARQAAAAVGARATARYAEIAADPQVDAVSVTTPDFAHAEIVTAMLEAGKHVLVEKPLATDVAEARAMVAAAQASGRHLMVDFQNRWNPPLVAAKQRIESGAFGTPVMASARLANTLFVPREMLAWAGRSGPQWFLLPHLADLVCWLFDRRAVRGTAAGRKGVLAAMGGDAYDAIQALVEFDDCSATLETAWILPDSFPRVVDFSALLLGTRERIALSPTEPLIEVSGSRHEWPAVGALQEIHGVTYGWQLLPILHFVDCLLAGETPQCTAAEGFHNTALIGAIEQSLASGTPTLIERL
ncbi:MAG: Gfo/Idh/MocA family oxidoreductase [Armatimonadetes bacterium]|nr:Gfo/Idh/MocA family oxidoreductase [Armatimonadota bacterium]